VGRKERRVGSEGAMASILILGDMDEIGSWFARYFKEKGWSA
jgi:prephenate dehydrogenase